jgi:GNAT superfamily N-acetyltransferase
LARAHRTTNGVRSQRGNTRVRRRPAGGRRRRRGCSARVARCLCGSTEETAGAAALRYDFSRQYLCGYFDKLKFGFTPQYRAGLEEFYRRAVAIGELAAVPDLAAVTLVEPAVTPLSASAPESIGDGPPADGVPDRRGGGVGVGGGRTADDAPAPLAWRSAEPADAAVIAAAIEDWWPGGHIVHGICPQLLEHTGDTCCVVEERGDLVGFLVGYLSQRVPHAGYIHYAGVRPDRRGRGIGRAMYGRFVDAVRERGCSRVLAETGTWNRPSIAFHRRVGFVLLPGGECVDGLPVHRDTTAMGFDYVRMELRFGDGAGG